MFAIFEKYCILLFGGFAAAASPLTQPWKIHSEDKRRAGQST